MIFPRKDKPLSPQREKLPLRVPKGNFILLSLLVALLLFSSLTTLLPSEIDDADQDGGYAIPPAGNEENGMEQDGRTRGGNYSVDVSLVGAGYIFYMEPGDVRRVSVIISNEGENNDSYYLFLSSSAEMPWPADISTTVTTVVPPGENITVVLNVTAPVDLFRYEKQYTPTFNATSRNAVNTGDSLDLVFVLSPVNVDIDADVLNEDGEKTEMEKVKEGVNEILYLSLKNAGNIRDEYDIALSGLSQGWNASFTPGKETITAQLEPSPSPSKIIPFVARCGGNSTKTTSLVVTVNSTIAEGAIGHPVNKGLALTLLKERGDVLLLLDSAEKYSDVLPGEILEVPVGVRNTGDTQVSFEAKLDVVLPDWLRIHKAPEDFQVIPKGEEKELVYELEIADDALAGSEILLVFSGTTREPYGEVRETWFHLRVRETRKLSAEMNKTSIELAANGSDAVGISIGNQGNVVEDIDIYFEWINGLGIGISDRKLMLGPSQEENVTVDISVIDPDKLTASSLSLYLVSTNASHTFDISINFTREYPERFPDLAFLGGGSPLSRDELAVGEHAYLNFTVVNKGDAATGPFKILAQTRNKLGSVSQPLLEKNTENMPTGDVLYFSLSVVTKKADSEIVVTLDPDQEVEELNESNNLIRQDIHLITKETPYPHVRSDDEIVVPVPVAVTGGALITLVFVITVFYGLGSESARYSILGLIVPLYSKLSRKDILDHNVREQVYHFVKNHPGEHYRSIQDKLELKNGTLAYHLHTLEKRDLLVSEKDGPYRRFYPPGSSAKNKIHLSGLRKEIYEYLKKNPGLSQKQIGTALNQKAPTVNYHITNLSDMDLIKVVKDGRKTKCFPKNSHDVM